MLEEEKYLQYEGVKLHVKLHYPENLKEKIPLLLIAHGFTGDMEEKQILAITEGAEEAGFASLRVELYGHGKSGGAFKDHTVQIWVDELNYMIEYARRLDFVSGLYLAGHSQGGFAAILAASQKTNVVNGLIPVAPAICIVREAKEGTTLGTHFDPENIPETITVWEDKVLSSKYIREAAKIDVGQALARYDGPTLFIHGTSDEVVPCADSLAAVKKYKQGNIRLMEGADHEFHGYCSLLKDAVCEFLVHAKENLCDEEAEKKSNT